MRTTRTLGQRYELEYLKREDIANLFGHRTAKWLNLEIFVFISQRMLTCALSGRTSFIKKVAEMVYGWGGPISIARALHSKYKKPVAYTEIGMCSGKCARTHTPSSVDYYHHAAQYQAVFEAFREESYFLGCFWWNWDTDPGTFSDDDCLTPQAKPAEDVLRKYYRATEPKGKPSERPALCVGDGKCTC